MKTIGPLFIVACIVLLHGCGSTVPNELVSAREAYLQASEGPAAEMSPAELHAAKLALTRAEEAFQKDSDSYRTRDLAYVAQRKAEMAEAQAYISQERGVAKAANKDFEATQGSILRETTRDLQDARSALMASELNRQATSDRLDAEQKAHRETGKLMDAKDNQRLQGQTPPPAALPAPPPTASPAPPPAASPAPPPTMQPASPPVAEASVEQRVATEVARLERERKAAEQSQQLERNRQDLNQTRTALAVSEHAGKSTAEQLAIERRARLDAESMSAEKRLQLEEQTLELARSQAGQAAAAELAAEQKARQAAETKAAESQAELAKLIAAQDDKRGEVFTLSGGLLFRSNEASLMRGAEPQLDRLVAALVANPGRRVVVEGHTDSQGSATYNLDLSQRRADAVRNYLVRNGLAAERVRAVGLGEDNPIADNTTSEGRANNRRVEVVLERSSTP